MLAHSFAAARAPLEPRSFTEDDVRLIGAARNFRRDQAVFAEGDAATSIYKVVSGAVRVFRLLADGRRQIVSFHLPGDVFGLEAGEHRRAEAEALGETVLLVAPRATLGDVGGRFAALALDQLQRAQDHVLTLGRRTARERIASFLLDLAGRLGGGAAFDLPMSRLDIADHLGLTIETVSRTLTQLQAEGLVELDGCRRVRLPRPDALAELCE